MVPSRPKLLDLPVAGGDLRVRAWGTGEVVALAVHGLTLNHAEFHPLAEQLASCGRLLAPDLRGRGDSTDLGPPYGLSAHTDDIAAVLAQLKAPPVVLIGHSWGAVVALVAAYRYPERVRSVVLVDGGLPAPPRSPASDQANAQARERVLRRLRATFASEEAYLASWRENPGLRHHWNGAIARAFAHDLTGDPPALRCNLSPDAFTADLASYLDSDMAERALLGLRHRAILLRAARNMSDTEHPQYSDAAVAAWRQRVPQLRDMLVESVNHYTILLGASGAKTVADIVRKELACMT
jgi:pimeloyl-ACP methyl ester carboxylesterase